MNHEQLVASAKALLDLDARSSLHPHGIGGHARTIIEGFLALSAAPKSEGAVTGEPDALHYAQMLAGVLHSKHYSDVTNWKPLPDTLGLLTQIDNMVAPLVKLAPSNPLPAAREEVGVTDAVVEAALHAHVPCGAEVWHWLPQTDADNTDLAQPHPAARNVMRAALEAALSHPQQTEIAPAAPSQEAVKSPSLLIQQAEEQLCTCGAGHGSLEGHIAECEWLKSEWCIWGDAVDISISRGWLEAAARFLDAASEADLGLRKVRVEGQMRTPSDIAERIRSALASPQGQESGVVD